MDDECIVTVDEGGVDEAVLNQETGELEQLPASTVYEGKCKIKSPKGLSNRPVEEGGQIYTQGEYELGLPLSVLEANPDQEPAKGMWVLVTSSRRDPGLVGQKFRIIEVIYGTFAVQRKCPLERRG